MLNKFVCFAIKGVLCTIFFVYLLIHCTYVLRSTTNEKENLMGFYAEEKDSLEVVCIGSSTMWCSLNPIIMYEEGGVKAYTIATSAQRPSSLKYLAKEAQKYQSDAMYVIDVSNFIYDDSTWEEQNEGSVRRVTDGLKYSWNRFMCNKEQIKGKSNKCSYYFDIIKYHSEYRNFWKNISHWNFEKECPTKGWLYNDSVESCTYVKSSPDLEEITPIDNQAEKELTVLLDFCDESDMEYLFIFSMTAAINEGKVRHISNVINERGYDVLIFHDYWDQINMDAARDFYMPSHVNLLGAEKTSRFFGKYLQQRYHLGGHCDAEWDALVENMADMYEKGEEKIHSGSYIESVRVEITNIDENNITFKNNTKSPQSLLYAWTVKEIVGEREENVDTQWYVSDPIFQYEFDRNKVYSVISFVKSSENETLSKYKTVAKLQYNHANKEWDVEVY